MPFTAYYLGATGNLRMGLGEREIQEALESGEGLLWVDIGDTGQEDAEFLAKTFNFHPIAVEACLDSSVHSPKVDDFGDYLFLMLYDINYDVELGTVETAELDLFLGKNFVVSNHNFFLRSVQAIKNLAQVDGRPQMDGRPMRRGVDFLAHALIDALVDNIVPTIDQLGDMADSIEEEIFLRPEPAALDAILRLKHSSLRLRRAMVPQRELLGKLNHQAFEYISPEAEVFYRDVYSRVTRIEASIENLRERADTIQATYLSAMANQQNESIRMLSVIAAVFLPLTLLAGIYGMNFEHMPELAWRWSYFAVLGFMGLVSVSTLWWFVTRRRGSLGRRRPGRLAPSAVELERPIGYVGHMARGASLMPWPGQSERSAE